LGFVLTVQHVFAADDRQVCGGKRKFEVMRKSFDAKKTEELKRLYTTRQYSRCATVEEDSARWEKNSPKMIRCLQEGANPDAKRKHDYHSLVELACRRDDLPLLEALCKAGANLHQTDGRIYSSLLLVHSKKAIELLAHYGADLSYKTSAQRNLLHEAIHWGGANAESIICYCNLRIGVNDKDIHGETPLRALSIRTPIFLDKEDVKVIKVKARALFLSGANPYVLSKQGKTPIDIFRSCNANLARSIEALYEKIPAMQKARTKPIHDELTRYVGPKLTNLFLEYTGQPFPLLSLSEMEKLRDTM